jgi:ABC-type dipeptide/oligopeptide/nickel transport system permease subunit
MVRYWLNRPFITPDGHLVSPERHKDTPSVAHNVGVNLSAPNLSDPALQGFNDRLSLSIGFVAVFISLIVGIFFGAIGDQGGTDETVVSEERG